MEASVGLGVAGYGWIRYGNVRNLRSGPVRYASVKLGTVGFGKLWKLWSGLVW